MVKIRKGVAYTLVSLTFLSACNMFEHLDHPTSDPQLLSAARGCFDQGDLACAKDLYGKLSNNDADIKSSELAFTILDEQGADLGAFLGAFAGGAGAAGLTKLSNSLSKNSGLDKRKALLAAFSQTTNITDSSLKGLVQFITMMAISAEILSEASTIKGNLNQADFVVSPATCKTAKAPNHCGIVDSSCDKPAGSGLTAGGPATKASDVGNDTATIVTFFSQDTPTIEMFLVALDEVLGGLGAINGNKSGGKLSDATKGIATDLTGSANSSSIPQIYRDRISDCVRQKFIQLGVGA